MKKLYSFIAALILLLSSIIPAQAQYTQSEDPLTQITAGQKVVLQNGRDEAMTTSYLKWYETPGTAASDYFTDKVDDSSIMEFIDAGEGTYYLYNPANQAYIEDINYTYSSDFCMHWTTDINKAAKFAPSDEIIAADQATPALMFHHEGTVFGMDSWYLCAANSFGRGAGFSYMLVTNYEFYNAWVVYEVVQSGGKAYLENVLDTYFPTGITEETWSVGTNPGCIPADVYSSLSTAYNNAFEANEAGDKDAATYTALADALMSAYNAALAAIIPLTPGYYYMRNYAMEAFVYGHVETSDETTTARWAYYELPETYESSVAPYIWKVEANAEGSGFNFYNPFYEKYITRAGSYGMAVPMQELSDQTGLFAVSYQSEPYARQGGYFNVTNSYFGGRILRAIGNDSGIGYSSVSTDPKDDDALWQFIPVPDNFVTQMIAEKESGNLAKQMNILVDASNTLLAKTKNYNTTMTTNALLDTPGLITSIATNAQEETEGDVNNAIDSDATTFFHTSWTPDSPNPNDYHNFTINLSENVQEFALKLVKRINSLGTGPASQHNPLRFAVYALNGENFDSIGTYKALYDQGFILFEGNTEVVEDMVSVTYIKLPYATNSLCVKVYTTEAFPDATKPVYFCLAEVGVYKAEYDAVNSAYENIPAEVREVFLSALATAEAELASGTPTQSTLQTLQEAYDNMIASFSDRNELFAMLQEARSYEAEAIEDDEELGYYSIGSVNTYSDLLNGIETRIESILNPTSEEFESIKADIIQAMQYFDDNLNKPDPTYLYHIQSASAEGDNYDRYLYTTSNDISAAQLTSTEVTNPDAHLNYMWRLEVQSDNTYLLRNAASGMYLGAYDNSTHYVTSTYEATPLRIVSARTPGALGIQTIDGKNLFALNYQQGVTLRENTQGPDGAAFTFTAAAFEGIHTTKAVTGTQIVTLPFDVLSVISGGTTYYFAGKKTTENGVFAQLVPYATTEIIPAATPFIVVGEENAEETLYFTDEENDGTAIEYVLTPGTAVGLIGTLPSVTIQPPYCVLRNNKIDFALDQGQTINPNSGYFDTSTLEETTVTGELQIPLTDAVSSIDELQLIPTASGSIYDLQGRRINRIQERGVYIIDGRKVFMK